LDREVQLKYEEEHHKFYKFLNFN